MSVSAELRARVALEQHGFRTAHSLGQNFLFDEGLLNALLDRAGVTGEDRVLEIGPGPGVMTAQLARRCEKVVSLEIDEKLRPVLETVLEGVQNVRVIYCDAMKADIGRISRENLGEGPFRVVANLPYYITTPAITALLDANLFRAITVMVQKEVAQRICAPAGSPDYSAFSVYIAYYADAEILFDVPRDCFVPQPKVDSAVVRLIPRGKPPVPVCNEKLFFTLVKAAFGQRRKTLANALQSALGNTLGKAGIVQLITDCGFDARVRGEKLSLADYAKLTELAEQRMAK